MVCVNCKDAHGAGNQKCPVQERQVEVSRVRVVQNLSYAEALKKVEEDGSRGRVPERSGVSSRSVPVQRDRPTRDIHYRSKVWGHLEMYLFLKEKLFFCPLK